MKSTVMIRKALKIVGLVGFVATVSYAGQAQAAGGHSEELPKQEWSFQGAFGTYDKAALQRGYKVYRQVCSACHSMEKIAFRNLVDLGYDENQIKAIAAEYSVTDGPDDEGEMFDRPALPSDRFPNPYPNSKAAAATNNGAIPPDLSLIAKARVGGPDYLYGILTGYAEPAHDIELLPGQYYNKYMPGNVLAMAPPLSEGIVAYEDGTPEHVSQYAKDVSHFLMWAAEPKLEARKAVGVKVFLFLLVFAGIMYRVKKKIWANAH